MDIMKLKSIKLTRLCPISFKSQGNTTTFLLEKYNNYAVYLY